MINHLLRFVIASVLLLVSAVDSVKSQQVVFLDFSGTDGSIVYSAADKIGVMTIMDGHHAPWDFTFLLSAPGSGPFSTVKFNAGGPGGLAEHIDFGNGIQ